MKTVFILSGMVGPGIFSGFLVIVMGLIGFIVLLIISSNVATIKRNVEQKVMAINSQGQFFLLPISIGERYPGYIRINSITKKYDFVVKKMVLKSSDSWEDISEYAKKRYSKDD